MKILAIIQARMASTRLPEKVLADIHGRPMLRWLLDRIQAVKDIDEIYIATTDNSEDDQLENWAVGQKIPCFRGSENDVLSRFFHCAAGTTADIIVRVTADDPLKDPEIIRQAIARVRDYPQVDYCSNSLFPTYPEGLDIEVFRHSALVRAYFEAKLPSEREHVTPYIWNHPDQFNLSNLEFDRDLSHWRWTVDKPEDLAFVREIFGHFKTNPLVSFAEVTAFIEANPQLLDINTSKSVRNEGYLKSLSMEKTHEEKSDKPS